jgi:radical SAM protein with 4Fe4S-binding SPASM domain
MPGRGNKNRGDDATWAATRAAMDMVIARAWDWARTGKDIEIVTGNNDADAVYLLHWAEREVADAVPHLRAKLAQWGGNSSGVNIANIDNLGNVHPDTMWWHYNLGNVKERPFSAIWTDLSDPIMAGLKRRPRVIGGRCGACAFFDVCGGNTRVRAMRITGDAWAEDPGCYLTDAEIGVTAPTERVTVTPYREPAMRRRSSPVNAALALAVLLLLAAPAAAEPDAAKLYAAHCASCHGADRLGAQGPALLAGKSRPLTGARAAAVNAEGRGASQMPGVRPGRSTSRNSALAAYIAQPLAVVPPGARRRSRPVA